MVYRKKITHIFKTNVVALLMIAFVSPLALSAQTKKLKEDEVKEARIDSKVRDEMEWMQQVLILSDGQYDKVTLVTYTYMRQSDSSETMHDARLRKAFLAQCGKKKDADLKVILTGDQYKTYLSKKDKKHTTARSPFARSY